MAVRAAVQYHLRIEMKEYALRANTDLRHAPQELCTCNQQLVAALMYCMDFRGTTLKEELREFKHITC